MADLQEAIIYGTNGIMFFMDWYFFSVLYWQALSIQFPYNIHLLISLWKFIMTNNKRKKKDDFLCVEDLVKF